MANGQSLLRDFFSAYFHEDWLCEADSPEGVIAAYLRVARPDDARSLSEAIIQYARNSVSDGELESKLFYDLGCYYCPSVDGLSAKAWLTGIATQLLGGASCEA